MTDSTTHTSSAERHQPFEWTTASDTRVILVHGYAGSPDQFRKLAGQLKEDGYDCAAILLPGHGSDSRAFGHLWEQEWQQHVQQEIDRLKAGYTHVFLVGHSLGGLLCLEYAAGCPVDAIVSISAPLGIRLNLFQVTLALEMLLTPPDRGREITKTYRAGFGVQMKGIFSPLSFIPPSISLLRSIRRVRRILPQVHVPVLIVQSDRDETISKKSADQIAGLLGQPGRILRLTRSQHAYRVLDEDERVTKTIREMIKILARSSPDKV